MQHSVGKRTVQSAYAESYSYEPFTAYENDLEKLFLHYVTGGTTLQGVMANTYLKVTDEQLAPKLTRAGFKFLSWAKRRKREQPPTISHL